MIYIIVQFSSTLSLLFHLFLGGKGGKGKNEFFFFSPTEDVASLAQFLLHVRTLVVQKHITTADLLAPQCGCVDVCCG